MSVRSALGVLLVAVVAVFLGRDLAAGGGGPKYPRVNTASTYVVDPAWPHKPADFRWGHVPGLAVDGQDNVYVFTRSEPPVQVYDSAGKLVRSWGHKTFQ